MLKKMFLGALALGALALVACGSSDNGNKDKGVGPAPDGIKKQDKGILLPDKGTTKLDHGSVVQPDKGGSAVCPAPSAAKTNSGKICNATTACPAGEECVALSASATNGMCVGKCCPDQSNPSNPVNTCPVADTTKQLSQCILGAQDASGNLTGYVCAWLCSVPGSGGTPQTYSCPDATSFDCTAVDPKQPDVKICVPK